MLLVTSLSNYCHRLWWRVCNILMLHLLFRRLENINICLWTRFSVKWSSYFMFNNNTSIKYLRHARQCKNTKKNMFNMFECKSSIYFKWQIPLLTWSEDRAVSHMSNTETHEKNTSPVVRDASVADTHMPNCHSRHLAVVYKTRTFIWVCTFRMNTCMV